MSVDKSFLEEIKGYTRAELELIIEDQKELYSEEEIYYLQSELETREGEDISCLNYTNDTEESEWNSENDEAETEYDVSESRHKYRNLIYEVYGLPIFSMSGARGRNIDVYSNKCIITTNISAGSMLSHNTTDGTKTIYYKDVIGLQYKELGFTIGYIQLETSANLGNNNASNFFNENTFTFKNNSEQALEIYKYIARKIEEIKS